MNYDFHIDELDRRGFTSFRCVGNSMTPIIYTNSTCTFKKQDDYDVGDIVFCKVKGRYIQAHIIKQKSEDGKYLISNNHGHINGWTSIIYGKVIDIKKGN